MLRSAFVIGIIFLGVVASLRGPFYALLFYLWIAYFRPEYWLWNDFFSSLNLSLIVGVFATVATLFASNKGRFGALGWVLVLIAFHSLLSSLQSQYRDYALLYWQDFAKSTTISILILLLVTTEERLRLALVVISFSLGLEATKQGWAQLVLNPGAENQNTIAMFGDNNGAAVGLLMLMPILVLLARTATRSAEKYGFRFVALGVLYRAISTYSRGGFLAAGALTLHYIFRSKRPLGALVGIAVSALLILPVLPDAFWQRMGTIRTAAETPDEADASVQGRLYFWETAVRMAADHPILGVGHNSFNPTFAQYDTANVYGAERAVHSVWFGLLSELGFVGLGLFVLALALALLSCRRAQRVGKRHKELAQLGLYGSAFEASLIVYAVGGSFLSFQYVEIIWHFLAFSVATGRIAAAREAALTVPAPSPVGGAISLVSRPVPVSRLALRARQPEFHRRPS